MEDYINVLGDFSIDLNLIMWISFAITAIVILIFIARFVIKKQMRNKEKVNMDKYIDAKFEKLSDSFIEKLIKKLNEEKNR